MNYTEWAARYPEAANALARDVIVQDTTAASGGGSEAATQQCVRLSVAKQGGYSWRNNVGATPARCRDCGAPQQPVRYGLANDSARLNERLKSSDLILAIPRTITPAMVGTTVAQFGSVECKRAGWRYTGSRQEAGQAAWLALINKIGGFAAFSTGEIRL